MPAPTSYLREIQEKRKEETFFSRKMKKEKKEKEKRKGFFFNIDKTKKGKEGPLL